jgi:hypothetical protein
MAEMGEYIGVLADTARILAEGGVQHVVEPVVDTPVTANGLGQSGRRGVAGDEVVSDRGLAQLKTAAAGIEFLHATADLDHGFEGGVPGFGTGPFRQRPDPCHALFDAMTPAQIHRVGLLGMGLRLTNRPYGRA